MRSFIHSAPLLCLVACVDGSSSDSITTTDSSGQPVSVAVGTRELVIESGGREATLAWTDNAVTIESGGIVDELATTDELGRWQLQPENTAFDGLGPMLGAAEQVAFAEGVTLPWRIDRVAVEEADGQSLAACYSGSTWVFGSSCYSCYNEVLNDQDFYGGYTRSSRSCDSGSIYTTCRMTFCY